MVSVAKEAGGEGVEQGEEGDGSVKVLRVVREMRWHLFNRLVSYILRRSRRTALHLAFCDVPLLMSKATMSIAHRREIVQNTAQAGNSLAQSLKPQVSSSQWRDMASRGVASTGKARLQHQIIVDGDPLLLGG